MRSLIFKDKEIFSLAATRRRLSYSYKGFSNTTFTLVFFPFLKGSLSAGPRILSIDPSVEESS
jgi:hypothetical protein